MGFLLDILLWGVAAPGLLAAACLAVGWAGAATVDSPRGRRASTCAIGAAYLLAHGAARMPWPVTETADRLAFGVLAVGAACLLGAREPVDDGRALVLRGALCAALPWWCLVGVLRQETPGAAALIVAASALLLFGAWTGLDALARRRAGPALPAALMVSAGCGAAALMFGATAFYARLAGGLAVPLTVACVWALRRPTLSVAGGAVGLATLVAGALWMAGCFLADLPGASALLLLVAPLAAWVVQARALKEGSPLRVAALAATAALLPAGGAVWIAWQSAPPPNPYY